MSKMIAFVAILLMNKVIFANVAVLNKSFNAEKTKLYISWDVNKSDLSISDSSLESPFLFKQLNLENWGNTKTVGNASVPYKSILFEGMPGAFSISLTARRVSFIDGVIPVPSQEKPCRCDIVPLKLSVDYNDKSYDPDQLSHIKKRASWFL